MTSTTRSLRVLYAPPGFAHGFCVVSEIADVVYKLDAYYDPATEREISYNDPALGVRLAGARRGAPGLPTRP